MKPPKDIHVVCKTTTGSKTLNHIARSRRIFAAHDDAATDHVTQDVALCGRPLDRGTERVFSNPWEELATAAASRACQTCLDVLGDERIRKACGR